MSTRRSDAGRFDHGAQYFTARDPGFGAEVTRWVDAGVAAPWAARLGRSADGQRPEPRPSDRPRYVGTPGMNAIAKHLAADLEVELQTRITRLARDAEGWTAFADDRAVGRAPKLVLNLPPAQAAALLEAHRPALAARLSAIEMAPCWAVMAAFEHPVPLDFDGIFVESGPLAWAARDSAKPGRGPGERWVLHASPDFSRTHLEDPPEAIQDALVAAFGALLSGPGLSPVHAQAHRWRYAQPATPLDGPALVDGDDLVLCGDWCAGAKVEAAYLSGVAAARALGAPEDV